MVLSDESFKVGLDCRSKSTEKLYVATAGIAAIYLIGAGEDVVFYYIAVYYCIMALFDLFI